MKLTIKQRIVALTTAAHLTTAAREVLTSWGFHWNPIAKAWVASHTKAREAVAKLIASGGYPGFPA